MMGGGELEVLKKLGPGYAQPSAALLCKEAEWVVAFLKEKLQGVRLEWFFVLRTSSRGGFHLR
jgi:hypothetical protein